MLRILSQLWPGGNWWSALNWCRDVCGCPEEDRDCRETIERGRGRRGRRYRFHQRPDRSLGWHQIAAPSSLSLALRNLVDGFSCLDIDGTWADAALEKRRTIRGNRVWRMIGQCEWGKGLEMFNASFCSTKTLSNRWNTRWLPSIK